MQSSLEILLEFIQICCKGRDSAMTGKKLASYFGCDKRQIQKEIEQLRREGFPVLSADQGKKGYFWPASPEEAKECFRSMSNRAKKTFTTLSSIQKGIDKEFGCQLELPDMKGAA